MSLHLLLHGLLVLLVFLLSHIRGLGDRLVQRGHAGLQGLDLLRGGLCSLFLGGDGLLQGLDLVAEGLGLALVLEGLLVAIVLLVVVIGLLLHHQRGHIVDHLHDRREVDSLVGQGQHHQVNVGSVGHRLGAHSLGIGLQCIQRFAPGLRTLQLQQAWARQCLLEEPEVLIAVQDLDGLLNGQQLLVAGLLTHVPFMSLGIAGLGELLQHIEILGEGILCILKFALELDKGDLENAEPVDLVRNGLLDGLLLVSLGVHQLLEDVDVFNLLLVIDNNFLRKLPSLHFQHALHLADALSLDLALEERSQHLPIALGDALALRHHVLKPVDLLLRKTREMASLDKSTLGSLVQRGDGLIDRTDVALQLGHLINVDGMLLLALDPSALHAVHCGCFVGPLRLNLLSQLRNLCFSSADVGLELRHGGFKLSLPLVEIFQLRLAVAHELVIKIFLRLSLLLDLF
mmetsp:Transcript_65830/g.157263  ORF Transcript_65830/g.157263 Transcript_65830/m.157263 type:complete len:458 (-) Transcript_65830:192-1565(-)